MDRVNDNKSPLNVLDLNYLRETFLTNLSEEYKVDKSSISIIRLEKGLNNNDIVVCVASINGSTVYTTYTVPIQYMLH